MISSHGGDCANELSSSSKSDIKKQYVIEDVGHFKYLRNNSILINFIDKVKLHFDDYSIRMYLRNNLDKCTCNIFLPDNSQHEICFTSLNDPSDCFSKYLNFLDQWMNWLLESKVISRADEFRDENNKIGEENMNMGTMNAYLSHLKFFNYTINNNEIENATVTPNNDSRKNTDDELSTMSVSNLLKENNRFLKNISKSNLNI